MQSPKITVLGAGSFFFGRPVIWNMVTSETLRSGTLALVDTNPDVLKTMMDLAKLAIDATGAPCKLIGSTNRRDVMKDSDFVVTTFSDRNAHFRGVDTSIAAKYGVSMCSSDTIGPGGIFRALREIPKLMDMAKDAEELCPNAWMVNFVNPTTVLGITLMRYSGIRSFAICDGHHEPHHRLRILKAAGILNESDESIPSGVEQKLDYRVAGVNHFTWVTRLTYDGKDFLPDFRKVIESNAAEEQNQQKSDTSGFDANTRSKAKFNNTYALALWDIFGAYPDTIGHSKEYLPYFQGYGITPVDPERITLFDSEERAKKMADQWAETAEFASGYKPITEFLENGKSDHATDIIESMWGNLGKSFYINTTNRGAVSNMGDDAFLELRSYIDMQGPRPQSMGEMPRGLLALQQQVLDTHELTAQAAMECDRDLLLRALCTDPIVNNIGDAKAIMEDLLEAERDALDEGWYK
jgi:alpha-galactosidase